MTSAGPWRCGSIAIVGKPNAGKSTLVNAIIGRKIVGIAGRPETTRHQILGVHTMDLAQLILLDTPGLRPGESLGAISQYTQKHAARAASEADLLVYLVDCTQVEQMAQQTELMRVVMKHKQPTSPVVVVLAKTDKLKQALLPSRAQRLAAWLTTLEWSEAAFYQSSPGDVGLPCYQFAQTPAAPPIFALSAKRKPEVGAFKRLLAQALPEQEPVFPLGTITNCSDEFIAAELIREQIVRKTAEELPYQTFVTVMIGRKEHGRLVIHGTIVVTKKSHKGMMIGRKGQLLKQIREGSTVTLRQYFGREIAVRLWVKVATNWHKNQRQVGEIMAQSLTMENPL